MYNYEKPSKWNAFYYNRCILSFGLSLSIYMSIVGK